MRLRADEAGGRATARQRWLPYNRISPVLRRAVLAAEDAGFWGHDGVDFTEIQASIEVKLSQGGVLRGGSTITQQLAKNLYLSPTRNPYRKVVELMIARRLEAHLSKTRIFELYLNLIEWGDGIWGADAAARAYFGRSASDVSAEQAALLAGAIINPRVLNPSRPNGRLLRRQQIILRRLGRGAPPTPDTVVEPGDEEDDKTIATPSPEPIVPSSSVPEVLVPDTPQSLPAPPAH